METQYTSQPLFVWDLFLWLGLWSDRDVDADRTSNWHLPLSVKKSPV